MRKFKGLKQNTRNLAILAGILLVTVSVVSSADVNLTVKMTEPFEVNGVIHPAGTLQMKTVREYTPTQTINELWLGGDCLGYVIANKAGSEVNYPVGSDTLFFSRASQGHLVLAGYILRGTESNNLYRYQHKVHTENWTARASDPLPVFIAASLR